MNSHIKTILTSCFAALICLGSGDVAASDMAGLAFMVSLPLTFVLTLFALVVLLVWSTMRANIVSLMLQFIALMIGMFMVNHEWSRSDDIELLRIQTYITWMLTIPFALAVYRVVKMKKDD